MKNRFYVVAIVALLVVIGVGAIAGNASPEDRANAIGARIMCPVCQGSAIANSPSETATSMMDKVDELVAAGMSDDQIITYFADRYGENIILDPAFRGKTLFVWLLPAVAFGLGIWMIARRRRKVVSTSEVPS
ncbi:MAG: cytochrome c-type biogenesis protein CcmH [Actinomycetia bacterium]|nr:cytochrome c-type biogenesis protein CcmH [Actinomycetes bacterium]